METSMLESKLPISIMMFISKKISELSELEMVFLTHLEKKRKWGGVELGCYRTFWE